jgi:hypothetical protein
MCAEVLATYCCTHDIYASNNFSIIKSWWCFYYCCVTRTRRGFVFDRGAGTHQGSSSARCSRTVYTIVFSSKEPGSFFFYYITIAEKPKLRVPWLRSLLLPCMHDASPDDQGSGPNKTKCQLATELYQEGNLATCSLSLKHDIWIYGKEIKFNNTIKLRDCIISCFD